MATLDWPGGVGIAEVEWELAHRTQLSRSAYTGAGARATDPWFGQWSCKVTLRPGIGPAKVRALRALLASVSDQVDTIRVPATAGEQKELPPATVQATAAQGARAMTIAGCFVQPGHLLTVNDQLIQVVTSAPSGSNCAITFKPPLRAEASSGTAVETGRPTCVMLLSEPRVGWTAKPGRQAFAGDLAFEEWY